MFRFTEIMYFEKQIDVERVYLTFRFSSIENTIEFALFSFSLESGGIQSFVTVACKYDLTI